MKLKTVNDFISWQLSSRTVAFRMVYVDITQDFMAGLLLSQILYWFLPSENGKSKLRVERNNRFWLCKSRKEWYNEIRISERQYDRASDILIKLKIIDCETFKFGGTPKIHIAVNFDVLMGLLNVELSKYATRTNTFIPKKPKKVEKAVDKDDGYKDKVVDYLSKQSIEYRQIFDKFRDYRKKKHPMTPFAEYLILNELEKYFPKNPGEHINRFKRSIMNGWQGVIFDNEKETLKRGNNEGYN